MNSHYATTEPVLLTPDGVSLPLTFQPGRLNLKFGEARGGKSRGTSTP
ncbi:hypothetical protein AGR4A_pTi0179 [Agrobacterium tumefaciens str. B6]|uniref:Uncharacterized protein n=1 Tax=Agrobacterium tumefaciens str. B6 TaxID=1183423 RepID=A0A822VDD9_AGRTU|nr:hypothetical protein AGR4A_pTi0179 [Agrobacterium tumefaciens str. B6]